jgi:hypothetical protein
MIRRARRFGAMLAVSLLALAGFAGSASAQTQDGLVNVIVGDVTIAEDVNVAVAANVAATVCDVQVGPLALGILGQAIAVDRSGRSRTICETEAGDVTITQN